MASRLDTRALRPVDPPGARIRPSMAAAVVHEGVAYLSGIAPLDDDGALIGPDDEVAQAEACMAKLERVLQATGAGFADVIRATCFVTSMAAAKAYIAARSERMTHRPAATTVMTSALLVPGAMLEIEVIARVPA